MAQLSQLLFTFTFLLSIFIFSTGAQQVRFINGYNTTITISCEAGTFVIGVGQSSNFTSSPSTLSVTATGNNESLTNTSIRVDVAGYTTVVGYYLANNASNGFNLVYFNESTSTATMMNNSATNGSIPNRNWIRVINLNKNFS